MKKAAILFAAVGVLFCTVFSAQAFGGQTPLPQAVDSVTLNVRLVGEGTSDAQLSASTLGNMASDALGKASIRVVDSLGPQRADNPPAQLRVTVLVGPAGADGDCAYSVDLSLWARARLESDTHIVCFARLWQADDASIRIAAGDELAGRVQRIVLARIGDFIKACETGEQKDEKARPLSASPAAGRTIAKSDIEKPARAAPVGEYNFVASRNGGVFHKPDCTWAKRIADENRIGFATRREAIDAGLRPCKQCKP